MPASGIHEFKADINIQQTQHMVVLKPGDYLFTWRPVVTTKIHEGTNFTTAKAKNIYISVTGVQRKR